MPPYFGDASGARCRITVIGMGPDADRHAELLIHAAVEGLTGVGVLVNGRFAKL